MDLEKYRNYKDMIMVRPVDEKDIELFSHCAYGRSSFPNRYFKKMVEPMLFAHNVKRINTIDRSKKKEE